MAEQETSKLIVKVIENTNKSIDHIYECIDVEDDPDLLEELETIADALGELLDSLSNM